MIDILKKRYKIGDIVTLHTSEESFTGIIDSFEDTCVILVTEEGEEFIANEIIKRVSVPKPTGKKYIEIIQPLEEVIIEKELPVIQVPEKPEALLKAEYQVGDKIPWEVLEKRIDNKNKNKFPKIKQKGITLGSLSDLKQLILPELEAENKKIVSANGTITNYFGDRKFGFITDKFGYDVWFGFNNIIDDSLLQSLRGIVTKANIPVLFTFTKNSKGDAAIYIQKPKSVEQVAELAKHYFEKKEKPEIALGLVGQILLSYPENYTALKLKKEIESKRFGNFLNKPVYKSYDLNYQKAVKAKNTDKNFDEALKYYFIAFENNEKRESCIKDIGILYVSMGKPEKALDFVKKYENELTDNITTYNYLENFYGSAKEFEKQLDYVELLLDEKIVINDKRKHSFYLSKKGFALIQLENLEEAREVLEEAVSIHPENTYANRLIQALDEPDNVNFDKLVEEAEQELAFLGSEVSHFLKEKLSLCEFDGLKSSSKSKILDSGEFKKYYLEEIRDTLKFREVVAGKSKERADYLLTEARLMQELEPDKETEFRSTLAKYCNAKASQATSEMFEGSLDVARYFYLEAFNLEDEWDSLGNQVAIYLSSLKSTNKHLITNNTPSFDNTLQLLFHNEKEVNLFIWNSVLSAFVLNKTITAQVLKRIYDNNEYKNLSFNFLKTLGINLDINIIKFNQYLEIWDKERAKRNKEYRNWLASLKAISNNDSLEQLTNFLLDSLNEAKKNWLTKLDTYRLNIIATDIHDIVSTYLRQSGYRDKERSYNITKAQINQLIIEIKEKPTKFSYEGFIPLLEKIEQLIDKSFKIIEAASTPKIKISILGETSVVGTENIVPFQITVENSKDSSPIRDVKVEIFNTDDIRFLQENNIHYDSIDGGQYIIFKISVQISDKIIKDKAATLDVFCEYKIRNQDEPVKVQEQLSLRLYSEDEFEPVENPFAPIADGGPVTDRNMFYGREEFINNRITAILNADSKQIIIYGQKRSGKSSVLHHLKQGLEATGKTFCISFSLGEIIRDLNEYTFYYKIIYGISRVLRLRKAKGETVPEFDCPTEQDFKTKYPSNPANGFIELIEEFQIACSELDDWKNKKLVIMIDEFTYLYTAIRNSSTSDTIMKQWKAITQNESAKFSVVLVGQDVVPSFKKENYAKNAFGVIEDIRLTYLDVEDARRLIQEPIINKNGGSRFIGRAVDTIIDYTSRNPYYIQIFCARLVDYMNAKKFIRVTEADIKEVAETFIEGSQALAPEKFDNLIRAGEEHDFIEFDDEPIIKILRQIAIGSKNIGICSRENISLNNKELENKILNHLVDREVLECKQGENYKIQVKLFQEWLLRH